MTPEEIQKIIESGRKLGMSLQAEQVRQSYITLVQSIEYHKDLIVRRFAKKTRRKMSKPRKKDLDIYG